MEITSKTKTANKLRRKNTWTALSFIAPNFIGFFLFTLIPVICSLILAFMSWDSFSTPEFVGMKNFTKMIHDDTFWISLKQNVYLYDWCCSVNIDLLIRTSDFVES